MVRKHRLSTDQMGRADAGGRKVGDIIGRPLAFRIGLIAFGAGALVTVWGT
jgi:hypothetical protein